MDTSAPPQDTEDLAACRAPGHFVDSDAPEIVAYAERVVGDASDDVEKARRLYYAVRDDLRYDPYRFGKSRDDFCASKTLERGYGFCVTKSAVLAAVARAQGIASRLGYADVKNHLTSPRLRKAMGTDVFAFHGYTDLFLDGTWVKATPAFDRRLCLKAGVAALEFDGKADSVYQAYAPDGRRHMEYLCYRGTRLDIPFDEMMGVFQELYGDLMLKLLPNADANAFENEVGDTSC
jgi:transglutaminase-like putative cysteine protease